MSHAKSSRAVGPALLVALILILVVVPGAWAASKYKTLTKFTHTKDGKSPLASLIFDRAGNLYGTTFVGGWPAKNDGTVFKLTPNQDGSWTESVLYRFCSRRDCRDGARPYAGLVFDQAGNLYGTTADGGGIDDHGVVFKLTPNPDGSWTESVLHRFCSLRNCADGYTPYGGLIFDQTGNLYGTTGGGGAHNNGTVFKLAENQDGSWSQSVLYSFCSLTNCADGGGPEATLVFDQVGNLYGTTNGGGRKNGGTVFKLTPNQDGSWTEKVLHDFCTFPCHDDGQGPHAAVILDGAGNLYGTTFEGGAHEAGVVFQLTPNADGSWTERVLHNFCSRSNCSDGGNSEAGLIFDASGNLYGTTLYGGEYYFSLGVVFKLAPNAKGGWTETVLHTFLGNPGSYPYGGLIFDGVGNLYGTTFNTVFRITP